VGIRDFKDLPKDAKNMGQAIQMAMAEATRRIATVGSEVVIDATPVLTTKAVSNWKVYIGRMQAPEQRALFPSRDRSTASSRGAAAKRLKKVESAERIKAYKKGSQPIWITNGVPYIKILERGGAKTRPHWMVAKGLLAMKMYASTVQIIKEAKKQKV
jgi:hypothetical protein